MWTNTPHITWLLRQSITVCRNHTAHSGYACGKFSSYFVTDFPLSLTDSGGVHKVLHNSQGFVIAEYNQISQRAHVISIMLHPSSVSSQTIAHQAPATCFIQPTVFYFRGSCTWTQKMNWSNWIWQIVHTMEKNVRTASWPETPTVAGMALTAPQSNTISLYFM